MQKQELNGLDQSLDLVFKQRDRILDEMKSLRGECQKWQFKFFPLLPQAMAHWKDVSLDSLPICDIPRFIEDGLIRVAGGRDGKLDAEALALLGHANGDLWSALRRLRAEVAPRLRVLARAWELHQPKVRDAEQRALQLLADKARPKWRAIQKKIALAVCALGDVFYEERGFRSTLLPGVGNYLPSPEPCIQRAGELGGVGPLHPNTTGNYLARMLRDGVIKEPEIPAHWLKAIKDGIAEFDSREQ